MTGINQTRFFKLVVFSKVLYVSILYRTCTCTIAAIRSVIGALWPPLWVPPKLARQQRCGSLMSTIKDHTVTATLRPAGTLAGLVVSVVLQRRSPERAEPTRSE